MDKRGASASAAAALVIIIGMTIVFYIILIPPEARQQLLGEGEIRPLSPLGVPSTGRQEPRNETLINVNIGQVDFIKQDTIEHELAPLNLYTKTQGKKIEEIRSLHIENSLFNREPKTISFSIDKEASSDVKINFVVPVSEGRLSIALNDMEIFNNEITTTHIEPIVLKNDLLKNDNVLSFTVSSPGFLFWQVHEYTLENLAITADVTDASRSAGEQVFFVESSEKNTVEKTTLTFYPDCAVGTVGTLGIALNGKNVYAGIPDCNFVNKIEIPLQYLEAGINKITWSAVGDYFVHDSKITTSLEEAKDYIYYFNLDEDLFNKLGDEEPQCGIVDNICPDDCRADLDKDCCFEDSSDNFWCDVQTTDSDDRCVAAVSAGRCGTCRSGYEDKDGEPAGACEGLCGDDTDNLCPIGCSQYFDKDCCDSYEYYWCDDVPTTGVEGVCRASVLQEECTLCADGYQSEEQGAPSCPVQEAEVTRHRLKSTYDVTLTITFVNDNTEKEAEILINNNKFLISTKEDSYERELDLFVRPDYNALKLIPTSSLDIVSLKVELKE